MTMEYAKPLPKIDERSRPWWEAARRHELTVQECKNCGHIGFPPAPICSRCRQAELQLIDVSGRGKVWSWTVFHKAYIEGFAGDIPYAVAIVELEEGPRMWTQIVGVANEDLRIGLPVEAVFDDVHPDATLVKFRRAGE